MAATPQPIAVDHFVTPIKQEKKWHCWAAGTAMIQNWKLAKTGIKPMTAAAVAAAAGKEFATLYSAGDTTGISATQEAAFYKALGFGFIRQQNPTIARWAELLRTKGPLGVTIDVDPSKAWAIHEIVVTTMKGDGTPDGTNVGYIDPADGLPHTLTFRKFVAMYEQAAGHAIQIAFVN